MAASRKQTTTTDGVIRAQLDGRAGYAVNNRMPLEDAVAHILEVAPPDRPELLAEAAGVALGAWEGRGSDPWDYGWKRADLLVAAGADIVLMEPYRAETRERLSQPFVSRHP